MLTPETALYDVTGIGPALVERLGKLGVRTVGDLLRYFPFRHEDYSTITNITDTRVGQPVTIKAAIRRIENQRSLRKRMALTKAELIDNSGVIQAIWFNQPFLLRTLKIGSGWTFHGKVEFDRLNGKVLVSPSYEQQGGILPVYHETDELSSKWLRRVLRPLLHVADKLEDYLPAQMVKQNGLIGFAQAVRGIHFPNSLAQAKAARLRLGFDELFLISLRLAQLKRNLASNRAPQIAIIEQLLKKFVGSLPFRLTDAQRRSAWQIIQDLKKPVPMNRLLEGEVGSGKTVVATMAGLSVAKSGYQTAWLAPTEILASQHFKTVESLLKPFGVSVSLMTKTVKHGSQADVVIGTHALLQQQVTFRKLGLVIVDEQHRFGVAQRAALKGDQPEVPHFLSMTATPIPRTLALALYSDLDVSVIDELPPERQTIITKVVDPAHRDEAYRFIRNQVKAGQQVYVITPLIEETRVAKDLFSELERKSAVKEYEKLRTRIFPDLRIGLLHGRLKGKEKDEVMTKFKNRQLDILVSTAVIEVGIDVPNATVMMIEDADRFGLAQLHQFRGRVGRGKHQSYCYLFSSVEGAGARLKAMERYQSGFELAEVDLKLRGPGELLGARQSGIPDLKMASLTDILLIEKARNAAKAVVEQGLENYPTIAKKLDEFERLYHLE